MVVCLAWPKPLVVGAGLVVVAMVLENLQSLLPDRSSYLWPRCIAQPEYSRRLW